MPRDGFDRDAFRQRQRVRELAADALSAALGDSTAAAGNDGTASGDAPQDAPAANGPTVPRRPKADPFQGGTDGLAPEYGNSRDERAQRFSDALASVGFFLDDIPFGGF